MAATADRVHGDDVRNMRCKSCNNLGRRTGQATRMSANRRVGLEVKFNMASLDAIFRRVD
jgi:hypothetical protein